MEFLHHSLIRSCLTLIDTTYHKVTSYARCFNNLWMKLIFEFQREKIDITVWYAYQNGTDSLL